MLKGTSSKLRKMLSKSPSKDPIPLTSGDGSIPSPDAKFPQGNDKDLACQTGGFSRDCSKTERE